MKRRGFLGTVGGGTVAVTSRVGGQSGDAVVGLVNSPLVVMAPREDGAEIVWAVSSLCKAWIEVKDEKGAIEKVAMDSHGMVPQGDEVVRVRLEGLEPGARYEVRGAYRVVRGEGDGPDRVEEFSYFGSGSEREFLCGLERHPSERGNDQAASRRNPGGRFPFMEWRPLQ